MFRVFTKKEYWEWLEAGLAPDQTNISHSLPLPGFIKRVLEPIERRLSSLDQSTLKVMEDMYILHSLSNKRGARILEVGGGDTRVLRWLSEKNECWLVDRFEGQGHGPTWTPRIKDIRIIKDYIGNFNTILPSAYFDYIVSISVIEHIQLEDLEAFFQDCARLLKPGGMMLHAIDTYVFDDADRSSAAGEPWSRRIEKYLSFSNRPDLDIRFRESPKITKDLRFSCRYATLSDASLYIMQKERPDLKREIGQLVGIRAEWIKSV